MYIGKVYKTNYIGNNSFQNCADNTFIGYDSLLIMWCLYGISPGTKFVAEKNLDK